MIRVSVREPNCRDHNVRWKIKKKQKDEETAKDGDNLQKMLRCPSVVRDAVLRPEHLRLTGSLLVTQVVLTNLALLAENGQMLMDAGLPEEFLVQVRGDPREGMQRVW